MDSLPRAPVNHVPVGTEELLNLPSNGESDCFNLFETGFYHSELNQMNMCSEEAERPAKRLKMGIAVPESFMNDVSVNNLGVDFENHTHHITSAKMAVSVADFSSLSANETNGFISTHTLHQHAALHSEWLWKTKQTVGTLCSSSKLDGSYQVCLVFHWKFELYDISDVFVCIELYLDLSRVISFFSP